MENSKELIGYKFKSAKAVKSVEVLTGLDMTGWAGNLENTGVNFLYGSNVFNTLIAFGDIVFDALCEPVFKSLKGDEIFEGELTALLGKYVAITRPGSDDFDLMNMVFETLGKHKSKNEADEGNSKMDWKRYGD